MVRNIPVRVLLCAVLVAGSALCIENPFDVSVVPQEYLVFFRSYRLLQEQANLLENIIGIAPSTEQWSLAKRHELLWDVPSDFAVLHIHDSANQSHILSSLQSSPLVKNIYPQKRYTREPLQWQDQVVAIDSPFAPSEQLVCGNSSVHNLPPWKSGKNMGRIFVDPDTMGGRRKLQSSLSVTHLFNSEYFWDKGITGEGVRVAIFDTGLSQNHPHFQNIQERTDWTDEGTLEDYVGHGTFVAGLVASMDPVCSGFAPDAELYIFRVFTNSQVSYTSWFLDAFNYAIHCNIDILNLSIGGPDWRDEPFVEKVWELSANNVIVVSAIGNDGPDFGTLNNPADMMDVLGVGGIDYNDKLASFSSRGMTTWELPHGYGRMKPDILAYGKSVTGSRFYDGCSTMSGTSVASPVVAGAVTLLVSSVPEALRANLINPASIKQVLVETASLLPDTSIYEQGFGKMNMVAAYEALRQYRPRASVIPRALDLTECPYMWPFCSQPLYYSGMPIIVNTTILNGMGVTGTIENLEWSAGEYGDFLEFSFTHGDVLWPWSGYLAIHIRVKEEAKEFRGLVEGLIRFQVRSPPYYGEKKDRITSLSIPLRAQIIPTPPRNRRVLWDQFHSLSYPLGFFPSDILWEHNEPFDWNADHLHTNFRGLYSALREMGYYVEVLGDPFLCFDASLYGTLLLVDSEENFAPEEREKLYQDVAEGLSLVVIADWYNSDVIRHIAFFDENTEKTWTPGTGGANLPALNELLAPYHITFGNRVYQGDFAIQGLSATYKSGCSIVEFPEGGEVVMVPLQDQSAQMLRSAHIEKEVAIIGLHSTASAMNPEAGRIAVVGDSSCFDDTFKGQGCLWLLQDLLKFTAQQLPTTLQKATFEIGTHYPPEDQLIPQRLGPNESTEGYTRLTEGPLECHVLSFQGPESSSQRKPIDVLWEPLMYLSQDHPPRAPPVDTGFLRAGNFLEGHVIVYFCVCFLIVFILAYAIRRKSTRTIQSPPIL